MIRRISAVILALAMLLVLSGCGQNSSAMIMVGLAMTGEDESTGIGGDIQAALEEAGHTVELAYGATAQEQTQQISDLVKDGAAVLVVHPVDSVAVEELFKSGKSDVSNVAVIACGAPIADESVKAYIGPDLSEAGRQQAEQVVKELALDEGPIEQPCTVELVAGNGAGQAIGGAMEVLQPYVDKGAVAISSGTDVAACHTLDAAGRIRELCSGIYADQELNAVLCLGEGQTEQVIEALKENYTGAAWPVVTGYGCNEELVADLAAHMLSMVTYAEELTKEQLTEKTVALADASTEEETQDSLTPCTAVTGSNYKELLVETGLYTAHKGGTFTKN